MRPLSAGRTHTAGERTFIARGEASAMEEYCAADIACEISVRVPPASQTRGVPAYGLEVCFSRWSLRGTPPAVDAVARAAVATCAHDAPRPTAVSELTGALQLPAP